MINPIHFKPDLHSKLKLHSSVVIQSSPMIVNLLSNYKEQDLKIIFCEKHLFSNNDFQKQVSYTYFYFAPPNKSFMNKFSFNLNYQILF